MVCLQTGGGWDGAVPRVLSVVSSFIILGTVRDTQMCGDTHMGRDPRASKMRKHNSEPERVDSALTGWETLAHCGPLRASVSSSVK